MVDANNPTNIAGIKKIDLSRSQAWLRLRQRLLVATAYTLVLWALPNEEKLLLVARDFFASFGLIIGGWGMVYCLLLAAVIACYLWFLVLLTVINLVTKTGCRSFIQAD
jgi:hypothetical protein